MQDARSPFVSALPSSCAHAATPSITPYGNATGWTVPSFRPAASKEFAVLGVGAFLTSGEHEHVDVAEQSGHGVGVVFGDQPLDDQHPAAPDIEWRQLRRISIARASFQSWITFAST